MAKCDYCNGTMKKHLITNCPNAEGKHEKPAEDKGKDKGKKPGIFSRPTGRHARPLNAQCGFTWSTRPSNGGIAGGHYDHSCGLIPNHKGFEHLCNNWAADCNERKS